VLGAVASGPLHLGRARTRAGGQSSSVLQALILGGMLLAVFLAGAVVVGRIDWLRGPVDALLAHARFGSLPIVAAITAVNGVAEELFFRGALFAAITPRWRVVGSAALYALATVATGVPLLVLAATALGLLTGLQRRVTGGVLGPIVTHLTWSLGMLFALPWALDLWS
jgi:membrane protease YdiL (CAAX protease family)